MKKMSGAASPPNRGLCGHAHPFLVGLLLGIILFVQFCETKAFSRLQSASVSGRHAPRVGFSHREVCSKFYHNAPCLSYPRCLSFQIGLSATAESSNIDESAIADIEEVTDFATANGVTLSFSAFGPGYRGLASAKNDPEQILGYIEGFIRPGGKILHADKMEIFKSALNSARRENPGEFTGGGTFLGPGLLIAYVCLLHGKENGCQNCEFLAIDDAEFQHKRLVRYYKTAGFNEVRYVGEELKDIPDRLVWGGCGTLMTEDIDKILMKWTRIIRGAKS